MPRHVQRPIIDIHCLSISRNRGTRKHPSPNPRVQRRERGVVERLLLDLNVVEVNRQANIITAEVLELNATLAELDGLDFVPVSKQRLSANGWHRPPLRKFEPFGDGVGRWNGTPVAHVACAVLRLLGAEANPLRNRQRDLIG